MQMTITKSDGTKFATAATHDGKFSDEAIDNLTAQLRGVMVDLINEASDTMDILQPGHKAKIGRLLTVEMVKSESDWGISFTVEKNPIG